jgi:predicted adenine nucleotide alpha hydrolase (AANH) superfamily ATPase
MFVMKVVLHICCAVCAAGAAKSLLEEGHQVLGFFYNPNIYPVEEYSRRLEAAHRVAHELDFELEEGIYNPEDWLKATIHLANEPEGGKRCAVCFEYRLARTYRFMYERGGDAFTTTLTVGPRKSAAAINNIGYNIGGEHFLARDFKKKDGFKRATALSKQWGLYRQNYCGCIYSYTAISG